MKRKMLILSILILLVVGIFYLQFSRKPTVFNVITTSDSEGYTTTLTIVMNQLVILNKEETKRDLINQIMKNDFQNMRFSYDVMGYPQKITVNVYSNMWSQKRGTPAFLFSFYPEVNKG